MKQCNHLNLIANGYHKEKDDNGVIQEFVDTLVCNDCGETIVSPPLTKYEFEKIQNDLMYLKNVSQSKNL